MTYKQQISIGIGIVMICLIKNYLALIKFDFLDQNYVKNRGGVNIQVYVKTMDMFVISKNAHYCDTDLGYDEKFCDIVIVYDLCYNEKLSYGQNVSSDIKHFCPGIDKTEMLTANTDFFYYKLNEGKFLANFKVLYPYVCYIYSVICDSSSNWVNTEYLTTLLNIYTYFEPRVDEFIVARWRGLTIPDESEALVEYAIKTTCQDENSYGSTCWLNCEDDNRRQCHCDKNKRGSDYACEIECMPGWINMQMKILIKNYYVKLRACYIIDHCKTPNYCKIQNATCLPYDNFSAICEILEIFIYSQMQTNGIKSNALYLGEVVVITLNTQLIYNKEIITTTSVTPDMQNLAIIEGIFDRIKVLHYTEMEVSSTKYLDKSFNFSFSINLDAWDRIYLRNRTFRINVSPDILQMLHADGYVPVQDIVYVGEQLYCNSSAQPVYRSLILWKSDILNISEPMMPYQSVDYTNPLFKGFVVCKVFMINFGRDTISKSINQTVRIRPFVIFEWSNELDLIPNVGNLTCLMKTYVEYTLRIIQMEGFTQVYTTSNTFNLKLLRGDQYTFVCMYNSSYGFFSTRYKRFVLTSLPTYICIFLHPRTLGSIVQCDHDGYIPESYTMTITVSPLNFASIPFNEGKKYLRIPYYLPTKVVVIKCILRDRYTAQILHNKTFTEILSSDGQDIYEFSPSNARCSSITNYIEMPVITKYLSNKELMLAHFIFFLEEDGIAYIQYLVTLFVHLLILFLVICWMGFLAKSSSKNLLAVFSYGDRLNKWRIRRLINDKLNKSASDSVFIISGVKKFEIDQTKQIENHSNAKALAGKYMKNSITKDAMSTWMRKRNSSDEHV